MRSYTTVGFWMHRDLGGDEIQNRLKKTLRGHGIQIFDDFDPNTCMIVDGTIWTQDSRNLSDINLLYQMNADDQSPFQNQVFQMLETQGVRVVNAMSAFNRARDKLFTNTILRCAGIQVPRALGLTHDVLSDKIRTVLGQWEGILLKPRGMHGGKSIVKWHDVAQLVDGWQLLHQRWQDYYLEEFIPFGDHDYRVEVIGGKYAGSYSRKRSHAFKTNISSRGGLMGITCPEPCRHMALRAVKLLGLDCSIVDMVQHEKTGQYYILEVNPALGVFNEAAIRSGVPIYHKGSEDYRNDDLKLSLLENLIINKLNQKNHAIRKYTQTHSLLPRAI